MVHLDCGVGNWPLLSSQPFKAFQVSTAPTGSKEGGGANQLLSGDEEDEGSTKRGELPSLYGTVLLVFLQV